MSRIASAGADRGHASASPASRLTHVDLLWIEKRVERWIRFGRIANDRIVDRRRRVVGFRPGEPFAFVSWAANDHGTIASRIDIVAPVAPGAPYSTLPFVQPGGELLLSVHGCQKVERVLRTIDLVEAIGIYAGDAAADHWRHVHNRVTAGFEPRPYSIARHRAWLQRRELGA